MRWPDWSGRTAVIVATGPSLSHEQCQAVRATPRDVRVLAVNDAGLASRPVNVADCATLWYAADARFWLHYQAEVNRSVALRACAEDEHGVFDRLGLVHVRVHCHLADYERRPGHVSLRGGHSGIQALELALGLGARRVLLLGFDCRRDGARTNYFGTKPAPLHMDSSYESWPAAYDELDVPRGAEVVNCTPGSAIRRFPFKSIGEALA